MNIFKINLLVSLKKKKSIPKLSFALLIWYVWFIILQTSCVELKGTIDSKGWLLKNYTQLVIKCSKL